MVSKQPMVNPVPVCVAVYTPVRAKLQREHKIIDLPTAPVSPVKIARFQLFHADAVNTGSRYTASFAATLAS